MSRTADLRLSGWVIDSNLFDNDMRFVELLETKGTASFTIYVIMRSMISAQYGYYAILNDGFILRLHRTLGQSSKGVKYIRQMITYFGKIGILDKCLLEGNVISSAEIQESWLRAKRARRAKIDTHDLDYWIIGHTTPNPDSDNCSNNSDKCSNNSDNCSNNSDNCTTDKTRHEVLVNETLKRDTIYTTSSDVNEFLGRSDAVHQAIENEFQTNITSLMQNSAFDSKEYLPDCIIHRLTSRVGSNSATDSIALGLLKQFSEEERKEFITILSQACYDERLAKYGDLHIKIDYKYFRAYVDKMKIEDMRSILWYLNHCDDNIRDRAYYLRGIIINKLFGKWKEAHRDFIRKLQSS